MYKAPFFGSLRALKLFSVCNMCLAVFGGPTLLFFGDPNIDFPIRFGIALSGEMVGWPSFSLSTAACFLFPHTSSIVTMVLHSIVVGVGSSTTALLTWLSKTYVGHMWYRPHDKPPTLRIDTFNVFGRKLSTVVDAKKLTKYSPKYHPLQTFYDPASKRSFFVHVQQIAYYPALRPIFGHLIDFEEHSKGGEEGAKAPPTQEKEENEKEKEKEKDSSTKSE